MAEDLNIVDSIEEEEDDDNDDDDGKKKVVALFISMDRSAADRLAGRPAPLATTTSPSSPGCSLRRAAGTTRGSHEFLGLVLRSCPTFLLAGGAGDARKRMVLAGSGRR